MIQENTLWERAAHQEVHLPARHAELSTGERVGAALMGGAMVAFGLSRRDAVGIATGLAGGVLLVHGLRRESRLYGALDAQPEPSAMTMPWTRPIQFRHAITVKGEPRALYERWRKLEDLPRFMRRIESITELDERRSRWVAYGPGGERVCWIAEITADEPGRRLAWRTVHEGEARAPIDHEGQIEFMPAPGERGTRVVLEMTYHPRGGMFGAAAAMLSRDSPQQAAKEDLRRFKQLVETGELTTAASPAAREAPTRMDTMSAGSAPAGATAPEPPHPAASV